MTRNSRTAIDRSERLLSEPTSTASKPSVLANQDEVTRGHIGLIVLGSIVGGLVLGLVLVLVVFAGASEPVSQARL